MRLSETEAPFLATFNSPQLAKSAERRTRLGGPSAVWRRKRCSSRRRLLRRAANGQQSRSLKPSTDRSDPVELARDLWYGTKVYVRGGVSFSPTGPAHCGTDGGTARDRSEGLIAKPVLVTECGFGARRQHRRTVWGRRTRAESPAID